MCLVSALVPSFVCGLSAVMFKVLSEFEAPFVCPLCVCVFKCSKEDITMKGSRNTKVDIQHRSQEFESMKIKY